MHQELVEHERKLIEEAKRWKEAMKWYAFCGFVGVIKLLWFAKPLVELLVRTRNDPRKPSSSHGQDEGVSSSGTTRQGKPRMSLQQMQQRQQLQKVKERQQELHILNS